MACTIEDFAEEGYARCIAGEYCAMIGTGEILQIEACLTLGIHDTECIKFFREPYWYDPRDFEPVPEEEYHKQELINSLK